ncbi:MAG: hypothetical protein R3E98_18060 [Gemmatimonadota bacterium]
MKTAGVLTFELSHQLRRAWYWGILTVLLVVAFLLTRDASLSEALREDFFANSPFAIAKVTVVAGLLWLVAAAAVAGEAGARDAATGLHPLVYTTPVRKWEYLGGRFLAAFLLNALLLAAVQVGALLALYGPGMDPQALGPFRAAAFLTNYAFLSLPSAFFATAIQFGLAVASRRPTSAYVGSFLLVFMGFFVAALLLFNRGWGVLLDPVGIRFVLDEMSHDWTSYEKSWRVVALEGTVLANRLVWTGVGALTLLLTWLRFDFAHPGGRRVRWWRRSRGAGGLEQEPRWAAAAPAAAVPVVARTFGPALQARQAVAIAWQSFRWLAGTWPGRIFLGVVPLLTVLVVVDQMTRFDAQLVPTTALILRELTGPLSDQLSRWVFVPFLIVFFAGELIWRERDAGLGEITDVLPGSEWIPLLGKVSGLGLLLVVFTGSIGVAGLVAQLLLGYRDLDPGLLFGVLYGLQLPEYLLFVPLAFTAHVVANQKYVGHLLGVLGYTVIVLAPLLGLEHGLLIYGASPAWSYTAMRGFGPSLLPWLSFKLYWLGWALLLLVVARLFWARGLTDGFAERWRAARHRVTASTAGVAGLAGAVVLGLGGFVFYNTNILHDYRSSDALTSLRADYERRYRRYAGTPHPDLVAADLRIEIHPEQGAADIEGAYRLENRTGHPIDTIHVALVAGQEEQRLSFDRAALHVASGGEELLHRLYALSDPLQPGEALRLEFTARIARHGFRESGAEDAVTERASFFEIRSWLPAIGYRPERELTSAADRRAHGLPPRPLIPSLEDADATWGSGDGVRFSAVVGTSAGQTAVAPGALQQRWTEGDRSYARFETDGPIGTEWAIASAPYDVRDVRWEDPAGSGRSVDIRLYHHPAHAAGVERILHGVRASLDYMSGEYGPYPYGHLTFLERPGNGVGMHSDPSLITYLEGAALLGRDYDPERLDLPFAVVAHEMGHQWHPPVAPVEGVPVLTEGVAWYYALRTAEHAYGDQVRSLLRFMRLPYPHKPIRRGEPLLRGVDPYMAYRRGPFALHALEQHAGGEAVNTALRRVLERHREAGAPPATMLDLYRELEAVTPDSLRGLLHDLFEVNTFWEFKTERPTAEPVGDGTWRVTIPVQALKTVVDPTGEETEIELDQWVEVGVYGPRERGERELSRPLYEARHRIRSGEQTLTVTVASRPVLAGVDPHHVLDWVENEDDDNLDEVRVDAPPPRVGSGEGRSGG